MMVFTGPAAARAPSCRSPVQPQPQVTALPWTQRWLQPARAWSVSRGRGVTVAVVDSGVDAAHPQLRGGPVLDGWDMVTGGPGGAVDCDSHGTGVASLIAAAPVDGVGFAGLAPAARILPVRVDERDNEARAGLDPVSPAGFAAGLRWAVDHGARVANVSIVFYTDHRVVADAVAYARERGVLVVAAAGNGHDESGEGADAIPFPAAYPGVVGVGAIGADGARLSSSYVGPHLDIVAPGADVTVANPGSGHRKASGTSFAAPLVSAAAALLFAAEPELDAEQVAHRLVATADPAGGTPEYGHGVVNPYRALIERHTLAAPSAAPAPRWAGPDPAAVARTERWARAADRATVMALAAVAPALLALLLAAVWRRGRRRGWTPTRHAARPEPSTVDDPAHRFYAPPV